MFNIEELQLVSRYLTKDYSMVAYKTEIVWNNSILVTDAYIAGTLIFNNYPNKETIFSNITTTPLNLNPNIGMGVLNARFAITDSNIYTFDSTNPILKNPKSKSDPRKLENYIRLQILNDLYSKIIQTEIYQLEFVLDNNSLFMDIGDIIKLEDKLITITGVNIDIDNAIVNISAVPIENTNPVVLTSAST